MASNYTIRQIPAVLRTKQPRVVASTSRRLASTSAPQTQNPAYPLYPSVSSLLHQKGIPESEVSKIPASGPKGRLLKGDVLAYLGLIASDYSAAQSSRIEQLAHLDLSNIKIAPPPAPAAPEPAPAAEKPVAQLPPTISVAVSISLATVLRAQRKLQKSVGLTVPLSTFVARATDLANDDLPRSPYAKPSADEVFDELLGAQPIKVSRGDYIPELNAFEEASEPQPTQTVKEDLIDFLIGTKTTKRTQPAVSIESVEPEQALNVFSLTVPVGEEKRARTFLERIKTLLTIEPARLVI
ncbi:putative pyruvate dehydrogenase complex component Pdx1 [Aspergillus mulundensis]|uniref:Putative mitochondrial E3-binding protein of the pyruvate dehydrogenase complex n=1 Tax=Aspergillus mulundensis TaxID=1810919 RepID=A0A3D8SKF3_9EURO|nr:putative mitochondrial E3-binding protein of the pyruvate dehydrogenase complex [Aspergillus mulundensis]RDW86684.1 putative mitochondrial E3-binding protein of the pyruvate dehydrogenase complex [Aspergillus mulundensis]